MRRALLLILALGGAAHGQALAQSPYAGSSSSNACPYANPAQCASLPALAILWGGPTSSQYAAGSLTANSGQAVTDTRASNVYCYNGTNLVLLSNNQPCVEAAPYGPGLRVEGSATNTILQSNTFSNASWSNDNSTLAQNVTGPDGVANSGWTFTDNSTSGQHRLYQGSLFGASGIFTWSVYAKPGTTKYILLNYLNVASTSSCFDVSACTAVSPGGSTTTSTQLLANGWCRVQMTITATALTFAILQMAETSGQCVPSTSFVGTGETVLLADQQLEQQAFASSYIPTTTVAVTRVADSISVASPLSGSGAFVGAATYVPEGTAWPAITPLLSAGTFGAANSWYSSTNNSGVYSLNTYDNADANKATSDNSTISAAQHRLAFSLSGGTTTLYVDGSSASSTASGTGSNTLASQPGTIFLGALSNGNQGSGWLTNICADPSISKCTP